MSDKEILALAVAERRLAITMHKDLSDMVLRSGQQHAAVRPRLEHAPSAKKLEVVRDIFTHHGESLPGRFCVYQKNRMRVREPRGARPPGDIAR